MRIAYENYLDIATLGATSSDASYPLYNLQDDRLSTTWKGGATTQTITIDLQSALSINTVAIINHNIASVATVTVSGGSTTATTAYSNTISYNANTMLLFTTSTNVYRYWKVAIANNTVIPEIGRIYIGNYLSINPSSIINFSIIKKRSDNVYHNGNRQKYASEGNKWRRFEFEFPPTDETLLKQLNTMYNYSKNSKSLIFCNFDSDRTYQITEPCYCSIDGDLEFTCNEDRNYVYSMSLEEEL